MADDDNGPHYIPELDPHGEDWKPGDGGQRVLWMFFLASLTVFVGAAIAFFFGLTGPGIALALFATLLLIPLIVAGLFF